MLLAVIILATIMAIFGVIGYLVGARSSFFTLLVVLIGMFLISRAGGTIAKLINGLYFGIRFVVAGGVQALGAGGDRAAAITQVIQGMGPVGPLVDPNSPGPELVIVLLILVLLSYVLARTPRLRLRGPQSGWGLVWGLMAGYFIGAYLLTKLIPGDAGFLWVPFGLGVPLAAVVAGAAAPGAPTGPSTLSTLIDSIRTASQSTLTWTIAIIVFAFLLIAALMSTRGAGRSRGNGTR